ncbi:MAG: hypothetical protein FD148_1796 [Methylocystaceae bacterium]|nr:MAG: hypothetical protein FD148_1796 [Methylocystaceae bacterium]
MAQTEAWSTDFRVTARKAAAAKSRIVASGQSSRTPTINFSPRQPSEARRAKLAAIERRSALNILRRPEFVELNNASSIIPAFRGRRLAVLNVGDRGFCWKPTLAYPDILRRLRRGQTGRRAAIGSFGSEGCAAYFGSRATSGAPLVVVILEFFRRSTGKKPVVLAVEKGSFETSEAAILYAQGALNYVVFQGMSADGCLVKTARGALICELAPRTRRS